MGEGNRSASPTRLEGFSRRVAAMGQSRQRKAGMEMSQAKRRRTSAHSMDLPALAQLLLAMGLLIIVASIVIVLLAGLLTGSLTVEAVKDMSQGLLAQIMAALMALILFYSRTSRRGGE